MTDKYKDNKKTLQRKSIDITLFTCMGLLKYNNSYKLNNIHKLNNVSKLNDIHKLNNLYKFINSYENYSNNTYKKIYDKVIHEFNCYLQLYSGTSPKCFVFMYPYNFIILKILYFHNCIKEHMHQTTSNMSLYSFIYGSRVLNSINYKMPNFIYNSPNLSGLTTPSLSEITTPDLFRIRTPNLSGISTPNLSRFATPNQSRCSTPNSSSSSSINESEWNII